MDFRKLFQDQWHFFYVRLQCEDEEDMNILGWDENFQWIQKSLMLSSDSPGIMILRLMRNGTAPFLHVTEEKPVTLISKVTALDFQGTALAYALSRFSILNR